MYLHRNQSVTNKMANLNKGVPSHFDKRDEDSSDESAQCQALAKDNDASSRGPRQDYPTTSKENVILLRGPSEDSDVFLTPTNSIDMDVLNVADTETMRERSNSEVGEVEFDIQVDHSNYNKNQQLPDLIQKRDHDRGMYYLPTIDEKIYPGDEYQKPSEEPAEIFIFNFETFPEGNREGTRMDVKALIEAFDSLKFNVAKERVHNDLTTEQVLDTIESATETFEALDTKVNCLIVIFMTHGSQNNIISTKNGTLMIEEIIQKFCDCDVLDGVPKWFTFLACKQKNKDNRVNKEVKLVSDSTFIKRLPEDVLVYFSTDEGNKSAREHAGTWVIQELCRSLHAYGRRDELFAILTRTNKAVTNNYVAREDFRQCPVILSTLQKKFYLTLSKDRIAQLQTLHEIIRTLDILKSEPNYSVL